jgi:hypothetical protein
MLDRTLHENSKRLARRVPKTPFLAHSLMT